MRSIPHQRYWLRLFGLGNYRLVYEKVSHTGIADENVPEGFQAKWLFDGEPARIVSMSIVSSFHDPTNAHLIIDHSRKIGERDLLHEFVHALNPGLPHEQIDIICRELIAARKNGDAQEIIFRLQLGLS